MNETEVNEIVNKIILPQEKVVINIDSTLLRNSACLFKYKSICLDGYREPTLYNDTQYGIAFHKFVALMKESGGDTSYALPRAIEIFKRPCKIRDKKDWMTDNHFVNTCIDYWERRGSKDDFESLIDPEAKCFECKGKGFNVRDNVEYHCARCNASGKRPQPMVEQQFSIKVAEDDKIIVNVQGTLDDLGKINRGSLAIKDYKTTSSWKIKEYLASYVSSPQLKLYLWAIKKLGQQHPDGPLGQFANQKVAVFIEGIFLNSQKETIYERSEGFYFKDHQMKEFEQLLGLKIYQIINLFYDKCAPIKNGKIEGLCHQFFPCAFHNVCHSYDDVMAQHILRQNFVKKQYSPLTFGEDL